MNYSEMLKDELIAECEKRGLDTDGVKATLIARLEADDKPAVSKPKKKKVFNPMTFRYEYK